MIFDVEGPVQAEVFVLYLDDDGIRLTGPCGPEPWIIEVAEDEDPLEVVARMTRANLGEPSVAHSTSWRRSRGAVILSFVVVVEPSLARGLESAPVGRADLARNEAAAAPKAIGYEQVLEHGLRHLAWLVRDDPVVSEELAGRWADVLHGYVPEPFRNLK